jgi:hypothetical protein
MLARKALRIKERISCHDHPSRLFTLGILVSILMFNGNSDNKEVKEMRKRTKEL